MYARMSPGFEGQISWIFIKGMWIIITYYVNFVAIVFGYVTYFRTKVAFQLILEVKLYFTLMWFAHFWCPYVCGAFIKKSDKCSRNWFQVNIL